jgi:hypothetical protein
VRGEHDVRRAHRLDQVAFAPRATVGHIERAADDDVEAGGTQWLELLRGGIRAGREDREGLRRHRGDCIIRCHDSTPMGREIPGARLMG